MKKTEVSKMLNIKDLQEILGIGRNKAYALMKSDCFPSIQLGRTWVVQEDSLEKWIKDNEYSRIMIE